MKQDERLYRAFLEELHELESFRMAYTAAHPSTALERDDPDVKRLIETLAFFAARTRHAGLRNIEASHRRIFQQFVPYLLTPLPAMGMVQAKPTGQFTEFIEFPKGSEIALTTEEGEVALFQTLGDLRLMPLSIGRVDTLLLPGGGFRLTLPMSIPFPRSDEIGVLNILIDYLNDYLASLRVLDALETHLVKAQVVFDDKADDTTRGSPCEVTFGAHETAGGHERQHPLQRERLFFHYPQTDLYLNIKLPSPPRNWQRFTICLDLDSRWPRGLRLNRDVFQLFVTPIINLQHSLASPLIYDGTMERCPIRHPATEGHFALHSISGVYHGVEGALVPMRSGILSSGTGTFELDEEVDAAGARRHWLSLHYPEAFEQPRTISIEALWLQPWFSSQIAQQLTIAPYRRTIMGLRWELLGDVTPHRESGFGDDMDSFLHLFVLQNKSVMNLDDLIILFQTLGSVWNGPFGQMRDMLTGLRVEQIPHKADGRSSALKLVYHLQTDALDPALSPLLATFVHHVERILDAWISDNTVEVRMEVQ